MRALHHNLDGFADPPKPILSHADAARFGLATVATPTISHGLHNASGALGCRLQLFSMYSSPPNGVVKRLEIHISALFL